MVLFFYLHIVFHLKTSDDLEIFEIDEPSKNELEEICDLRQPLLFAYNDTKIGEAINKMNILDNYGAFDIKVRNVKENDDETEMYSSLVYNKALQLLAKDTEQKYISECNQDFIEETTLHKNITYNDAFLRPSMVASCNYDILMGSMGSCTPFQYKVSYRNYLLLTEGSVKIRLAPPKSSKYLNVENDYENFEFRSRINPWHVQSNYKADFGKIKCLDIDVNAGQIVYIPAYWFYSIKFDSNATICNLQYKPYMNILAIAPQLFLRFLQNKNIKHNSVELAKGAKVPTTKPSNVKVPAKHKKPIIPLQDSSANIILDISNTKLDL
jgi:hypothetical protein